MIRDKFTGVASKWTLMLALVYALTISEQCSTPENADDPESVSSSKEDVTLGLTGRWKHVSDFYSIGDATIHWRDVDSSALHYLQFNADSTIESNIPDFAGFRKYSIVNGDTIQFDSASIKKTSNHFDLKSTGLEISLHCIEPCGLRLIRETNDH